MLTIIVRGFTNGINFSMSNMGITAETSICGMLLVADQTDPASTSPAESSREMGSIRG